MAKDNFGSKITFLRILFSICFILIKSPVSTRSISENDDDPNQFRFEGDILGLDRQAVESIDATNGIGKNGVVDGKLLWTNNIIPYVLNEQYNDRARKIIFEAIRGFNSTCLHFLQRMEEEDYVRIAPGIDCSSEIGKRGGRQTLSIANSPLCLEKGIVQHELMHLIGFYHEQSRLDRDNYVDINYSNIEESNKIQFKKYPSNVFNQPYDFESVMHYGKNDFAKDSDVWTIRPKARYAGRKIGQRIGLSETDIKKINLMYKCADQLKLVAADHLTSSTSSSQGTVLDQTTPVAAFDVYRRWLPGIVPYQFSTTFENNPEYKNLVLDAMKGFNHTCIRFVPYTEKELDYLIIATAFDCSSYLGKQGGGQILNLTVGCLDKPGKIQHQLMHALGFYHEHNRMDRDNYVDINEEKIDPGNMTQFRKYKNAATFGQPYDFGSVMHLGKYDFAIDPDVWTIRPKPAYQDQIIGQRDGLSETDIKKINLMYNCPES